MDRRPRHRPEGGGLAASGGEAQRDALDILERAALDEAATAAFRHRLVSDGLPRLLADDAIRPHLRAAEAIVEVRDPVIVERLAGGRPVETRSARLYVTTERVIMTGAETVEFLLSAIDELSLSGERVLVFLTDGTGLRLDGGRPRLLRAQIAGARAAFRG